jgi:transcriptional regulator with XRE-family HTH domain
MIDVSPQFAHNLRRLMAHHGLTLESVSRQTGLDIRTIKGILHGVKRPHARTLHKLAHGLGVSPDEFFQNPSSLAQRGFDRETNPVVDALVASDPRMFGGWTDSDFDELYSRVGVGGALSSEGAKEAALAVNQRREIFGKIALLLESSHGPLLVEMVDILHRQVAVDVGETISE